MKLTQAELKRLIVEQIEEMTELEVIEEELIGEETLEESKAALAALVSSLIAANPALAASEEHKGAEPELKSLGIDLAALASETPERMAAKEKMLKGKAKSYDISKLGATQQTGPLVPKVPEYQGKSIVDILAQVAKIPGGIKALADSGITGAVTGTDPQLPSKFDKFKAAYPGLVNSAYKAVKAAPSIAPKPVKTTPKPVKKMTPKGGVKLNEVADIPPPPAYVEKAPMQQQQAPFGATIQQPSTKQVSDADAEKYGKIIAHIFGNYKLGTTNEFPSRQLIEKIKKATGSEVDMPAGLSPDDYKRLIAEDPKIVDGLMAFKKAHEQFFNDIAKKFEIKYKKHWWQR